LSVPPFGTIGMLIPLAPPEALMPCAVVTVTCVSSSSGMIVTAP
jgi:hypothetical protein